jgi:hypothetical protein
MRFNAVVLYSRKRLTGWELNPRAQLINTPNTDIIYLISKGTDMEREGLLKFQPLHFPNRFLRRIYAIPIPLPSSVGSLIIIMIA